MILLFPDGHGQRVTLGSDVLARETKTSALSVAKFTLEPGRSSGTSFNRRANAVLLIIDGIGRVHLGDRVTGVCRDSIILIPAEVVHSIDADTGTLLSCYAISAPAFAPEDYVSVK